MDTLGKVSGGDLRKAITTLQSAVRLKARLPACRRRPLISKLFAACEPRGLSAHQRLLWHGHAWASCAASSL